MRGRSKTDWWGVVLEAPDAAVLAAFYAELLGWSITAQEPGFATIAAPKSHSYLSFNSSADYLRPVWPAADGRQQMMMHVDIEVDDLADSVAEAIELGATVAGYQPQANVTVMIDPAGHPFCFYTDG